MSASMMGREAAMSFTRRAMVKTLGLGGAAVLAARRDAWAGHGEIYWHFVTGIWLVLFTILYLI